MTEYEIADLALSSAEAIRSQSALIQDRASLIVDRNNLFYTLLFSYLIVAYLVGAALTKVQLGALNLLYICGMAMNRVTLVRDLQIHREFTNDLHQLHNAVPLPEWIGLPGFTITLTITTIMILVSLFFMWRVRHPKKE